MLEFPTAHQAATEIQKSHSFATYTIKQIFRLRMSYKTNYSKCFIEMLASQQMTEINLYLNRFYIGNFAIFIQQSLNIFWTETPLQYLHLTDCSPRGSKQHCLLLWVCTAIIFRCPIVKAFRAVKLGKNHVPDLSQFT